MINNQNILLLYKENNVSIGYVFAKKIDDYYLIDGLYIEEEFRNKKIGTILLNEIIKEIYLLENYNIFINVLKENISAVNLYKKIGFTIKDENELKYFMIYKG